jgi:hypothetical protein
MSTLSSPTSALSLYTAQEPSPTSPTSTLSSDTAPELSHTSQRTIPTLLGKSNFKKWHASINPLLLSNPQSRSLISGSWFEPPSPRSPDSLSLSSRSSTSPTPTSPAPSLSLPPSTPQTAHRAYELANLLTTRFIRGTLAMNVIPFVRQHTSAKGLYEQLIYLYGERAGIDTVGGPPLNLSMRRRATIESSIGRIDEEGNTSPMLPAGDVEVRSVPGGRLTTVPGPGQTPHVNVSGGSSMEGQAKPVPQKKINKKFSFRFTNAFPFRRSSKGNGQEDSGTSQSSVSKILLSPIEGSTVSPGTLSRFQDPHTHAHGHARNASTSLSPSILVAPPLTPAARSSFTSTLLSNTDCTFNPVSRSTPAEVEMTSLATNMDFETPMESESEGELRDENENERDGKREGKRDSYFV